MASWPPSLLPIAHGEPVSSGPGVERVVRALAVDLADRVDRRQVDDVEAHRGDRVEALGGGAEVAAGDLAGLLVPGRALRAREELVPAAVEGERPVGVDRVGPLDGDEVADRVRVEQPVELGVLEGGQPGLGRAARCRPRRRSRRRAPRARACPPCRATAATRSSSSRPSVNISSTSTPAAILIGRVVLPGGDRRRPGVHLERPGALGVGGHPGVVLVGRAGVLDHPHRRPAYAVGAGQDDVRAELVVALAEHRRRHGKARRGSPWPAVDRGRRRA